MFQKLFTLFFCFLVGAASLKLEGATHPKALSDQMTSKTLFIQDASTASLKMDPHNPSQFILTLKGIQPRVIYMTWDSQHLAGVLELNEFLSIWNENELSSPHSIVRGYLSFKLNNNASPQTDTFLLTNPLYNRSTNSLTFSASPILNNDNLANKTERFKNIVLVFDGLSLSKHRLKTEYKISDKNPSPTFTTKTLDHES